MGTQVSEVLEGMAVEQLAAVHVDVDAGFPREHALAVEQLDEVTYAAGELAWTARLADGGEPMEAYRLAVAAHQDRIARPVMPLEDELESWLTFLHCYGRDEAPFALLEGLELTLGDVARLGRRWKARFEASPRLGKQAQKGQKRLEQRATRREPIWLPVIEVGEAQLLPSPAAARAKRRAAGEVDAEEIVVDEVREKLSRMTLDVYAAFVAALRVSKPDARRSVLAKMGLTSDVAAELDRVWQQRIADDAVLRTDFRVLTRHFMEATRLRSRGAEAAANHVIAALELPEPISVPVSPATVDQDVGAVAEPTRAPASAAAGPVGVDTTATGLPALILDEALPFVNVAAGPPSRPLVEGLPTASDVGATATVIPALRAEDILPFEGAAPAGDLDETSALMTSMLELDTLPFGPKGELDDSGLMAALDEADLESSDVTASPRDDSTDADDVDATGLLIPALLDAQVLPFGGPPPALPVTPALTLEQYASLSVELTLWPGRRDGTLERYGVTDLLALRRHWDAKIQSDPLSRQRYARACADYRRWLTQRG